MLIVCSKWSQAENISTETHKAVSCHNAGYIGIQSFRNKFLLPNSSKSNALERMWSCRRCLVMEKVSMVPPSWYSMLMFRSCHGRAHRWQADVAQYDTAQNSFGRMPIRIKLGDFLQKKSVNSKISLVSDLSSIIVDDDVDLPVEVQQCMKLFVSTPTCFEFLANNHFKDPALRGFM